MIPKIAVRRFLNRPLESSAWIKRVKRKDLLEACMELRPRPDFDRCPKEKLFKHQLACFLLGVAHPQFAFWLDMGTGKTRITLELLRYYMRCGVLKKAVIFITSDKAYPTWAKQIKRFKIDMPHTLLEGSSEQKWRAWEEVEEGLVFISYPGAVHMFSTPKRDKRGRKKKGWMLDKKRVEKFAFDIQALVMDESTRASGRDSLTHSLIERMGKHAEIRYALAGRPFGRDPTLLYTQHKLVDGGETLGPTVGLFRAAFFTEKPHRWSRHDWMKEYTFDKTKQGILNRMIQHRSITYAAEECIDLPKLVSVVEQVGFSVDAQEYYDQALAAIVKAKGDIEVVKNVFLRMRQLTSGFIGYKNDQTGERAQIEFDENPKFDRLMELLEQLSEDRKAVVFYDFTYSGRKIAEAAKKMGMKPIWLWAGTKNYKRDLHNFENDPRYRLAVIQNKVGAMSLDGLQEAANYCFFYESPVSSIDREQAERRLRRQGQKRKVIQYDLVVRNSVDLKILAYYDEAEGLMKAILRDPGSVLHGRGKTKGTRRRDKRLRGHTSSGRRVHAERREGVPVKRSSDRRRTVRVEGTARRR